jgi:hypothetical protein
MYSLFIRFFVIFTHSRPANEALTAGQTRDMMEITGGEVMTRKLLAGIAILSILLAGIPAGAATFAKDKAGIKYGGVAYRIGQTSTGWKSKLGSYTRKLLSDGSIASYSYTFKSKGVRVYTLYSKTLKKEKIASIVLVGKSAATVNGLKVGDSGARMTKLYGSGFHRDGNLYTYKAGGRHLTVKASGNRVSAIKIA